MAIAGLKFRPLGELRLPRATVIETCQTFDCITIRGERARGSSATVTTRCRPYLSTKPMIYTFLLFLLPLFLLDLSLSFGGSKP